MPTLNWNIIVGVKKHKYTCTWCSQYIYKLFSQAFLIGAKWLQNIQAGLFTDFQVGYRRNSSLKILRNKEIIFKNVQMLKKQKD